MVVTQLAGKFHAKFLIEEAKMFSSVEEALDWKGFKTFLPEVETRDDAMSTYSDLYGQSSGDLFCAWTDKLLTHTDNIQAEHGLDSLLQASTAAANESEATEKHQVEVIHFLGKLHENVAKAPKIPQPRDHDADYLVRSSSIAQ